MSSFIDTLPKHTILLTRAGSRVYGMQTATSDVDIKGVAVPPEEYILGTEVFEQADKVNALAQFESLLSNEEREIVKEQKLEGTVYDCRKFVRLAIEANPNILDVLFCADKDVLLARKGGEILRESRELFLSAKAKHTFSGYAIAQMKRIRTHRAWLLNPIDHKPTRQEFGLPEYSLLPPEQLKAAEALVRSKIDSWEFDLSKVEAEADRIEILGQFHRTLTEVLAGNQEADERVLKWRAAANVIGINDNLLLVMDRERRYRGAMTNWHSYVEWQANRNKDRAQLEAKYGFDTKHGAHLVRLMRMGIEILTTGKVNVCRTGIDADELKGIRAGAWSYEQLDEYATKAEVQLDEIYNSKKYVVPHSPKRAEVVRVCTEAVRASMGV